MRTYFPFMSRYKRNLTHKEEKVGCEGKLIVFLMCIGCLRTWEWRILIRTDNSYSRGRK